MQRQEGRWQTVDHPSVGRFTRSFRKGEGWREQRKLRPLRDRGCPFTGAEAPSREMGQTRLEESQGQRGLCLEQAGSHELRCQKELWKISGLGFRPLPPFALPLCAV